MSLQIQKLKIPWENSVVLTSRFPIICGVDLEGSMFCLKREQRAGPHLSIYTHLTKYLNTSLYRNRFKHVLTQYFAELGPTGSAEKHTNSQILSVSPPTRIVHLNLKQVFGLTDVN